MNERKNLAQSLEAPFSLQNSGDQKKVAKSSRPNGTMSQSINDIASVKKDNINEHMDSNQSEANKPVHTIVVDSKTSQVEE